MVLGLQVSGTVVMPKDCPGLLGHSQFPQSQALDYLRLINKPHCVGTLGIWDSSNFQDCPGLLGKSHSPRFLAL